MGVDNVLARLRDQGQRLVDLCDGGAVKAGAERCEKGDQARVGVALYGVEGAHSREQGGPGCVQAVDGAKVDDVKRVVQRVCGDERRRDRLHWGTGGHADGRQVLEGRGRGAVSGEWRGGWEVGGGVVGGGLLAVVAGGVGRDGMGGVQGGAGGGLVGMVGERVARVASVAWVARWHGAWQHVCGGRHGTLMLVDGECVGSAPRAGGRDVVAGRQECGAS